MWNLKIMKSMWLSVLQSHFTVNYVNRETKTGDFIIIRIVSKLRICLNVQIAKWKDLKISSVVIINALEI